MADLIGGTTRGLFRTLMTDATVGEISAAFEDEHFAANPDCAYQDTSVRRQTTQSYLEAVNWTDARSVDRFLRVAERLLDGVPAQYTERWRRSLRRDGYDTEEGSGRIRPLGVRFTIGSMAGVSDPSAIREQLDRISRAVGEDPALAVGSAKELVETTAKVVSIERGRPVDAKADLPELARAAQLALGLHPSVAAGPDGSEGVKRILGAVTTIANGLAELRNSGHGTGHGPATARIGLGPRHAHLAVNAAVTWCQLMLDTLADPDAPWHQTELGLTAVDPSTGKRS